MILRSQSPWEKHPQPLATVVPEQCPARHDAKCFTCTASLSPHRRLLRLVPLSSHLTDLEPEAPEVKGLAQYAHLTGSRTTRLESRSLLALSLTQITPSPTLALVAQNQGAPIRGHTSGMVSPQDGLASAPLFPPGHEGKTEGFYVPKGMRERLGLLSTTYPIQHLSFMLPASAHHACFFMTPLVTPSSHCFGNQECSTIGNQRLCFWCSVPLGSRPFEGQLNRLPPHPWMGRAPAMSPVGVDWGAPQGYWGVSALPTPPQSPPISPSVCLPPTPHSYLSLAFPTPSLFLSVF